MLRSFSFLLLVGSLLGLVRAGAAESMDMKATPMKSEILAAYVKISAALAADDLKSAKLAAIEVAGHADMAENKALATQANAVAKADSLSSARENFKALSVSVEPYAAGEKGYVVMYCPMADSDWVQASAKVKNPYYGKAMLGCGGPKK